MSLQRIFIFYSFPLVSFLLIVVMANFHSFPFFFTICAQTKAPARRPIEETFLADCRGNSRCSYPN